MAERKEPKLHFTIDPKRNLKNMSLSILRDIVGSIKKADFHSIMVHETSDVSNKELAVFCVRCVDKNVFSYENF